MLVKTREENFGAIESFIKESSGYEVPEVVSVKPDQVNHSYLTWLEQETKTK